MESNLSPIPPKELTPTEKLFSEINSPKSIEKPIPSDLGKIVIKSSESRYPKIPTINSWIFETGAFDGPSPDDVVLTARKGTALGVADRA